MAQDVASEPMPETLDSICFLLTPEEFLGRSHDLEADAGGASKDSNANGMILFFRCNSSNSSKDGMLTFACLA
jgi:hypothetical protein